MCFSNEPMICLYGEFGVRLEDHFYMSEERARLVYATQQIHRRTLWNISEKSIINYHINSLLAWYYCLLRGKVTHG